MGQWSRGGMIMVGDMFNNALKARVDQLCRDLSDLLGDSSLFVSRDSSRRGHDSPWWPDDCGAPQTAGAQNDLRYAYFPDTRRLAIAWGDRVEIYATGDHRISGVSQQQGARQDLEFTSQLGIVALQELQRIGSTAKQSGMQTRGAEPASREAPAPFTDNKAMPLASSGPADDVFGKLERLHVFQQKGILSEAEFAEKKKELLARL